MQILSRRSKIRRILAAAVALPAAILGFAIMRIVVLYHNTARLTAISSRFPRDYYIGSANNSPMLCVTMGDSTALGTGARDVTQTIPYCVATQLAAKGYRAHVINLAVSGATIGDARAAQLPACTKLRPGIVTINCGANDATRFTPLSRYSADWQAILGILKSCGANYVIVAATPDMAPVPALPLFYNKRVSRQGALQNARLMLLIGSSPTQFIDLYGDGKLVGSPLYASDDFHPSPAGYRRWEMLYSPVLDSIPGAISLHPARR